VAAAEPSLTWQGMPMLKSAHSLVMHRLSAANILKQDLQVSRDATRVGLLKRYLSAAQCVGTPARHVLTDCGCIAVAG
jgi:hypothetical protein